MVESADAFERQRNPESWLFTNSYWSPHPPGGPASDGNYARVTRRQSHYCGTSDIFIGGRRIATRWFRDRRYFICPGNILSFPTRIREKKNRERMDEIVPTNLPWSNDFESGAFLSICSESLIASWRVVNFLEERQRWFQVGDIPSINRNFINFFPNRFRILTDFVLQITFFFIFFSYLPYSSNITENNYTLLFSM